MSPTTTKHNKFVRLLAYPFRTFLKRVNLVKYVEKEYRYVTGHKLNLIEPKRYTEKLQYLRLLSYPNNKNVIQAASKVGLREFAKNKGFERFLIKSYGVFDNFDDIVFAKLPDSFVIKCSHASGFNKIIYDKNEIDIKSLKKQFNKWMKTDYGFMTAEPHYSKIKPQIIIEELLLENGHLPIEYKIHVFNGKAKYMYVVTGRDSSIYYNNYYIDWTSFDRAQFNHWTTSKETIKRPSNWDEAVLLAESLASEFPFVRVDLYIIKDQIYISEMTFTPAKGTLTFADDNVDYEIGEWLTI